MDLADKLSLQAFALEAGPLGQTPGIARGVHLKLQPSTALGLPVAPTQVFRLTIDESEPALQGIWRTDAHFRDSYGMPAVIGKEFGGIVRARLGVPLEDVCVFVELLASPDSELVVEGWTSGGANGSKLVATRKQGPYALSGFGIDALTISGRGSIMGVRWIGLRSLLLDPVFSVSLKGQWPWAFWNLPVATDRNYLALRGPKQHARERVLRGAPPHWPSAAQLGLASMSAKTDLERIEGDAVLREMLNRLIRAKDPSAPSDFDVDELPRAHGHVPRASYRPLVQVLAAATDPSVARWLGLADVDSRPAAPGTLTAYVMRTFWAVDRGRLPVPATAYPEQSLLRTGKGRGDLARRWVSPSGELTGASLRGTQTGVSLGLGERYLIDRPNLESMLDISGKGSVGDMTVAERWIAAVVRVGAPPEPPPPPSSMVSVGETWRQDPIAVEPTRVATVAVDDMVEAGGLALARRVDSTTALLNPAGPGRVGVAMLGGTPSGSGATASTRVLVDDGCPGTAATYAVAQRDWAGQWSPFRDASPISAGRRLPPPEPQLEVRFTPSTSEARGPERGTFTLTVPVPVCAPGGYPLARLELELDASPSDRVEAAFVLHRNEPRDEQQDEHRDEHRWAASGTSRSEVLVDPKTGALTLLADLPGPALSSASRQQVRVHARWVDTQGSKTAVVRPAADGTAMPGQLFDAVDTRPPSPPSFSAEVRKTSRPDPEGLAWLRVELPQSSGVAAYRMYMSNATLAAKHLKLVDAPKDRTVLEALPRGVFELVGDRVPVTERPGSFVYPIAGASRDLTLLRVVPESEDGAAVAFTDAPLLLFEVPDPNPPSQPTVLVHALTGRADGYQVTLRVELASGGAPATSVRLRRTRILGVPPVRMAIVARKLVDAGATSLLIDDVLPLDAAWTTITWVAEAQADGEAGTWSPPSAPAQRVLITDTAPAAPQADLDSDRQTLRIRHAHAARHPGFTLLVALDGAPLAERGVDRLIHTSNDLLWQFDDPFAPGKQLAVRVRDPLNRVSPPLTLTT